MPKNRTDYVILGMLGIGSGGSGYEIRKAIEETVGSFWGESYGQIYPSLRRLAVEGLVEERPPESRSNTRRHEYALTESGRACFREWLRLPFQNDPPRNEFLLKLFFGGEAGPQVSIGHVREVQRRNRQMLDTLHGIEAAARNASWQHPHRRYWMLTLNLGLALTKAALAWCESALTELETLGASGTDPVQAAATLGREPITTETNEGARQ